MSMISNALEALHKAIDHQHHIITTIGVYVRLVFLRIGEIDTLNERYQAQASIEARWPVELNKLSLHLSNDDQKRLSDGKSISLQNYAQSNWHPQLYIENTFGELKEQIRYTAKKSKEDNQIYICEHRDIKGLFWEKLELHHFPSDVQDLSISIASMFYDDKVILIADPNHLSGVNREAFVDQQEWSLYEHVDTQQRFAKEFIFDDDDDDDDEEENDNNNQLNNTNNNEDRKRSILTITCHAARRSSYFYWNGYCLILLITLLSFCIFAIPPHLTGNRIQISCTLLLTSITFRWVVNRSLPTISYLTSMDIYAILCIFILIILCIWHAIIGFLIFKNTSDSVVTSKMWFTSLDRYAFCISMSIFIGIHIIFLIWLIFVPLKHRKNMANKDIQYGLSIVEKKRNRKSKWSKEQRKKSSVYIPVPILDTNVI
ncbi:unnamed protein product [Rotaria sordida]|uniref:Neurotransmitter-gated ion-channel transmembrane domain-containing protein n=1 Tax=Rotaria sordida TaxID=392033 RepID=A0A815SHP7_9BILA|nr:unnamed protein product [Rotaria sordida]